MVQLVCRHDDLPMPTRTCRMPASTRLINATYANNRIRVHARPAAYRTHHPFRPGAVLDWFLFACVMLLDAGDLDGLPADEVRMLEYAAWVTDFRRDLFRNILLPYG